MSTSPEIKQEGPTGGEQAVKPAEQLPQPELSKVTETPATSTPAQIAAQQVQDDQTQQQQDDTGVQVITLSVPATPEQLTDWSKGPPENSLTWAAFYWIRMIKKAVLHGWRVISAPVNAPAV